MIEKILKRDGTYKEFTAYKIEDAIKKAFESENVQYDKNVFYNVLKELKNKQEIISQSENEKAKEQFYTDDFKIITYAVEDIQDTIEYELYRLGYFNVMRSFILYRHMHKMQRESLLDQDTTYVNTTQTIHEYINSNNAKNNQNQNIRYSHAGLVSNIASKVIVNYWLDRIYSKEEGRIHSHWDFYIHDLGYLTSYCAEWSLKALLNDGFNEIDIKCTPPNHFAKALAQISSFLTALQSECSGAQALSSFDTFLAPYILKDKLEYDEIKKAIKGFVYSINMYSRYKETAITNISVDWVVSNELKDKIPTRNNKHLFKDMDDKQILQEIQKRGVKTYQDLTYKDFQKEADLINTAFYEVMTQGDMTGKPFSYPVLNVNVADDFELQRQNNYSLLEDDTKTKSPFFKNILNEQNSISLKDKSTRDMCCELQFDLRELIKRSGGLFSSAEITGSIGVVTINMARLGFLYKGNEDAMLTKLDQLMQKASSTLEKKRVFLEDLLSKGLFPYTKRYIDNYDNHFSTIAISGIDGMIRNFTSNSQDIDSAKGKEFATSILNYMSQKIAYLQKETRNLYNLELTPDIQISKIFEKEDKKRYGDLFI